MQDEALGHSTTERLAVVGGGTIACGIAVTAARHGTVLLLARTPESALRARAAVEKACERLGGEVDGAQVVIVTDAQEIESATFVVEAVSEDHAIKVAVLGDLRRRLAAVAILATTTSSLSVEELAAATGVAERFVGLHVFNPVPKMALVELIYPAACSPDTRLRTHNLCLALGKLAVEVPDIPGFVVNRLLFPYLFAAVRLLEQTHLAPEDVDICMKQGAGHPMGPLALLDLVGLDVSIAIGEAIGEPIPDRLHELVDQGALGRKSRRGFHDY
jgi:3-hydroxybutyryl-CoA dehydrogenase